MLLGDRPRTPRRDGRGHPATGSGYTWPAVLAAHRPKLEENRFCVVAGRMGAGAGEVKVELFVNDARPAATLPFPVNPKANASKMPFGYL